MCTNFQKDNSLSKTDIFFSILRMDDYIAKIVNFKYITKFTLLKGFWEIHPREKAKEISASVTADGLFRY